MTQQEKDRKREEKRNVDLEAMFEFSKFVTTWANKYQLSTFRIIRLILNYLEGLSSRTISAEDVNVTDDTED